VDPLDRLRALCLALPQAIERDSHGPGSFFVQNTPSGRRQFLSIDDHHHGVDHVGFWCAAPAGSQEALIAADPRRYFRPPYVGHRGWVGVRLAAEGLPAPDWTEIEEIVHDAYRTVASPRLRALLS
jgi:hypothetical protein